MAVSNATRYLKLAEAPAEVKRLTGEPCCRATVFRWRKQGIRGVRLRCIFFGGAHRTTREWLEEFFVAVAAAPESEGRTNA
ncbi:DUF1580 domain-containing protein [Roseimaritima sediminicola]|uniref:DUF1580 domain-containing protein n=1 Tax=Roseimaritima sediminicola TaxID=2662066 RepID=UPI001298346F